MVVPSERSPSQLQVRSSHLHWNMEITQNLLHPEGILQYQSLIGSLQWCISIGRIDIATAVMTLSSFRAIPRQGHLDRAKRVVGYIANMKHAKIRVRVHEPDYSTLESPTLDWSKSVYGDVKEEVPQDAPKPLGKYVTLTHYVDANLYHDQVTGRSVTGILHMVNGTPIEWYSKKQATVETATYGSEFVAARTCVEQIIGFAYHVAISRCADPFTQLHVWRQQVCS